MQEALLWDAPLSPTQWPMQKATLKDPARRTSALSMILWEQPSSSDVGYQREDDTVQRVKHTWLLQHTLASATQ